MKYNHATPKMKVDPERYVCVFYTFIYFIFQISRLSGLVCFCCEILLVDAFCLVSERRKWNRLLDGPIGVCYWC